MANYFLPCWITITDATFYLFRTDNALPSVPPVWAAWGATISEHLFSVLLSMTLVLEVFVYPDAWPTHLSWAAMMLPLIVNGGGRYSLHRIIGWQCWLAPR